MPGIQRAGGRWEPVGAYSEFHSRDTGDEPAAAPDIVQLSRIGIETGRKSGTDQQGWHRGFGLSSL